MLWNPRQGMGSGQTPTIIMMLSRYASVLGILHVDLSQRASL